MKTKFQAIAPRVLADSMIAFFALAASLSIRYLIKTAGMTPQSAESIRAEFTDYFRVFSPVLALSLAGGLSMFGAYTRTRFYLRREKAIRLLEGVCLGFGIVVFLTYAVSPKTQAMPRGVLAICFPLTLAAVVCGRWAKSAFEEHFVFSRVHERAERPVRKVLVVGGAGYIGSSMVRDLLIEGYKVRVLDSAMYGDESITELYDHPNFEMIRGDFRNVAPVVRAVKGMDAVIHLGAIVGDPACAVNEEETVQINLAATKLLAEVCGASNVSRLLFASTCSVYGAAGEIVDENSWLNPVSLYAASKIDSERVLLSAKTRDLHPTILRLATAYGWSFRPRFDLVVNLLTAKAVAEKKIIIFNGQQWRPFIHIRDISRAFRLALSAPLTTVSGETFNIGDDTMNHTLHDVADQIQKMEPDLNVEHVRNDDSRTYRVSFKKIRTRLGFTCQTTLADGIEEIRQAIRAGKVSDYRDPIYSNVQLVTRLSKEREGQEHIVEPGPELTTFRFTKSGGREQLREVLPSVFLRT